MGRLNAIISPDDLRKGDLVEEVGWYPSIFTKYEEEDADTDGSLNILLYFKITDGPGKSKGIVCRRLFNEKALGFGKALWKMWGFPYDEQTGVHVTSPMIEAKLGSPVRIYIKRGMSNKGNPFNDVTDFMPV